MLSVVFFSLLTDWINLWVTMIDKWWWLWCVCVCVPARIKNKIGSNLGSNSRFIIIIVRSIPFNQLFFFLGYLFHCWQRSFLKILFLLSLFWGYFFCPMTADAIVNGSDCYIEIWEKIQLKNSIAFGHQISLEFVNSNRI